MAGLPVRSVVLLAAVQCPASLPTHVHLVRSCCIPRRLMLVLFMVSSGCVQCPSCLSSSSYNSSHICLHPKQDILVTHMDCSTTKELCSFSIWHCPFGMWFTHPMVPDALLADVYRKTYHAQAKLLANSTRIRNQVAFLNEAVLANRHRALPQRAKIVSVGCADGLLEQQIGAPGRSFTCFEPSYPRKYQMTESRIAETGARVTMIGSLWNPKLVPESIDLFISSHVLEHVNDICRFLKELYTALRPGGSVFTEIPVYSKAEIREYRAQGNFHLNFFTAKGFLWAMEETGFRLKQMTAYPVTYSGPAAQGKILISVFERPDPNQAGMRHGMQWS